MPLAGKWVPIKWALALDYTVGFRGFKLTKSVAVMTAESGRWTRAWNDNDNGSTDRGLFQINSIHNNQLEGNDVDHTGPAYEAIPNATYAFKLSDAGNDWSPWYAYGNANYLAAYTATLAVQVLGLWRKRLPKVSEYFAV